jgi:metal-responsive CopG/Arc/MetJ family transcriptional regulator
MAAEPEEAKTLKRAATSSVRATISFPSALYEALEELAKQKKVSLAWVVRDATEQYVGDKWPLFRSQG